jgi:hypothetical protein
MGGDESRRQEGNMGRESATRGSEDDLDSDIDEGSVR